MVNGILYSTVSSRRVVVALDPETGKVGAMLRAYDKATGADVGAVHMTAPQSGSPMTYQVNDQQYIVVATSGGGQSGALLAYRLPSRP